MNNTCSRHRSLSTGRNVLWSNYFVNNKLQFIHCFIPKVACTSWKIVLVRLAGKYISDINRIHLTRVTDKFVKRAEHYNSRQRRLLLKKYYKFMFVREPLERLVSAYRDKLVNTNYQNISSKIKKQRKSTNRGNVVLVHLLDVTFI